MAETKTPLQRMFSRSGFSLVEALMAAAISVVFLGTVMSAWYFSTKSFKEENVRTQLRLDLHKSVESSKKTCA